MFARKDNMVSPASTSDDSSRRRRHRHNRTVDLQLQLILSQYFLHLRKQFVPQQTSVFPVREDGYRAKVGATLTP